jgi:uncharacterized membrane protein YeaQ/YmgE (transglycosylase-associated protein family)
MLIVHRQFEDEFFMGGKTMLDIIGWIILGLIAGAIAKAIMPGSDPGGVMVTILLGIVGAIIGGFIGRALLGYGQVNDMGDVAKPGFFMSLILSVAGAVILLAGYRMIKGRSLRANS